jgi:hypothetical protein
MGIGDFFRGILAQVNPFDGGKTYGTYNPPKKKPDDQFAPSPGASSSPAPSNNSGSTPGISLTPQTPQNLFAGLQGNLKMPGQLNNSPSLQNSSTATNLNTTPAPAPGTIITPNTPPATPPTNGTPTAPGAKPGFVPNTSPGSRGMQDGYAGTYTQTGFVRDAQPKAPSFWDHVGNGLKTVGETALGTVANIPEVGLAAGRVATGLAQGVTQLPHLVTAGVATGTQALNNTFDNRFTHAINTGAQDANTGIKTATNWVNTPINALNRGLDSVAADYQNAVPQAAGGAQVYKITQIPINVLAALATLGGSAAAEGAGAAGDAAQSGGLFSKISGLLNKPLTENTDNIIAKTGQAVGNRAAPIVQAINTPFSTAKSGITRLIGQNPNVVNVERALTDAGETGNVLGDAGNTTQIPVQQPTPIDVNAPPSEGTNVPVNVTPKPTGRPIIEVGGDKPGQVHVPSPDEIAAQKATDRFNAQPAGRPDPSVDGVTSAPRPAPFKPTPELTASSQNGIVDSYAKMLKDMGQGNGTQLVPDGEGGYYRTSNNVRSAENSGKRMTNQDWRDEATSQLQSGKAEPGHQSAFNDAASPEIQSLLATGDRTATPPVGRPIAVKEVKGIPVRDESTVPTGMVETPGTVRVSDAKAPSVAKSEAIAAKQTAPITDIASLSKTAKNSLENDTTGIKPNGVERSGSRVENATAKPVEYRRLPDGSVTIVDGRHTLEYARKNGINDFPTKDVTSDYGTPATPTAKTPAQLPADVQNVLDNPKQFNKVQVAAARNQLKLANQMAKTKEATAAAVDRIETASPAATSQAGHAPTGQFDTSANGGAYQTASRAAEKQQAAAESSQMSPGDAVKTARANEAENGAFARRDIRNIRAMFDDKRILKGTPEYNEARQILKEDGTQSAQALALRGGQAIRRTASPDELMSQFETKIYRLANDPSKIDSKAFDAVEASTTKFTDARDAATQAYNRFTESPTSQNAKVYHAAQDAADAADRNAKLTEFNIAKQVLKGNKDVAQVRELQKMAKGADMYQMDGVDASMLSGTGTFARNFVNSGIGAGEEGLFGGLASRIASKITGENVGGGFGKGSISGFGKGVGNIVDASKARASNAGWNPLEHLKNYATTGNQLGDSVIDGQVTHNVLDHYTQMLKDQGYKGSELRDRAGVMARQDPEDVGKVYAGYARAAAGLGSGITRSSSVETAIKNGISDAISFGNPNQASEFASKLLTRMTVGFPTAVGRTITEGAKRATFGAPTALKLFGSTARNDPAVRAQIIKEAIKQGGSGAATSAIFYGLGQQGLVTGSYPSDPATRAEWQREGITENSIKIDGNYYQLPSYLGSAALPALFAATLGRNNGDVTKSAGEVAKAIPSILPTSQADNVMNWINGKTNSGKFLTQTGASAVRAITPAGALLNQLAKSFDTTTNDTTTGTALNQFVDKVMTGIPGASNVISIPSKTDDNGNVLHNPSALPLAFGASSAVQGKGVAATNAVNDKTNTDLKTLNDAGAFSDPNIKAVLGTDANAMKVLKSIQAGQQPTPAQLKTLRAGLTKGVPTNGDDTAYLEKGQYDSNLTALNIKRAEMAADPTVRPSDLAKMDLSIKRGAVYRDNKIPFADVTAYKTTSVADWRKLGEPTSDTYDPAAYQKLWQMDQLMTKAGASYDPKDPTGAKFSAAKAKAGKGAAGSGSYNPAFGQLKPGSNVPSVQNYQTIAQQAGTVPVIQIQRPNVVHAVGGSH